ncbi:plant U-box 14 [Artemisia annua]|uniref:Plant U-box 14 n=1 Tax=Artemisia annua TaxID=35608 RepID=A0A2U1PW61_ARTAN|nr:plant U-box 14 [Artemisia annua]
MDPTFITLSTRKNPIQPFTTIWIDSSQDEIPPNNPLEKYTPSPNLVSRSSMLSSQMDLIFSRLVARCFKELQNYAFVRPLKGDARTKHGDYVCLSVLEACEEIRDSDPYLFDKKSPRAIAEQIMGGIRNQNGIFNMINQRSIRVHDAGMITFRLLLNIVSSNMLLNYLVSCLRVVEKACRNFVPHLLCEYLFDLSKLFMSYHLAIGKASVKLCRATEVVISQCFQLLGINPSQLNPVRLYSSSPYPFEVRRNPNAHRFSRSRFELFTMRVFVAHPAFDKGSIFGKIWVNDENLARSDWTMALDDHCYVSYFDHEWHQPLNITYGSLIPFGDPSCRRSVPISDPLKVHVLLHAMSDDKQHCYLLFHGRNDEIRSRKWYDTEQDAECPEAECGTMELESRVGTVLINYILLKNAVDALMELQFWSRKRNVCVKIHGSIIAYYGDDLIKDGDILGRYKAVIFRTTNFKSTEMKGALPLHRSLLAVPANGCLTIKANLVDVTSGKKYVREESYRAAPGKDDNLLIECKYFSINLKVSWREKKKSKQLSKIEIKRLIIGFMLLVVESLWLLSFDKGTNSLQESDGIPTDIHLRAFTHPIPTCYPRSVTYKVEFIFPQLSHRFTHTNSHVKLTRPTHEHDMPYNRNPILLKGRFRLSNDVIGFKLCSTKGPPIDLRVPVNPVESLEAALKIRVNQGHKNTLDGHIRYTKRQVIDNHAFIYTHCNFLLNLQLTIHANEKHMLQSIITHYPHGKKDAATTIFNLCIYQGNKVRVVRTGIVTLLMRLLKDASGGMMDEALVILAILASHHEGKLAIAEAEPMGVLVEAIRTRSTRNGDTSCFE